MKKEIEQRIDNLKAEVESLENELKRGDEARLWVPERGGFFWSIEGHGGYHKGYHQGKALDYIKKSNCFPSGEMAEHVSKQWMRALKIIKACAQVEMFEPNWSDGGQLKYSPFFDNRERRWLRSALLFSETGYAHVSSEENSEKVLEILSNEMPNGY